MARLLGHRRTKGAATDKPNLRPPRHISTLPGNCLWLLFFLFSLTAYAAAGETSRAMRLALLISATRRS